MLSLSNPIAAFRDYWSSRRNNGQPDAATDDDQAAEQPPISTQLKLSREELDALKSRITSDYLGAIQDHKVRMLKCAEQERMWREIEGLLGGAEGKSNFRVPLTTALLMAKHAREVDALFGNNAAVNAMSRGPTDANFSKRVGLAMTWQLYENMRALKAIALWSLRRLKHGRAFAKIPWEKKFYNSTKIDDDPDSPTNGQRITRRVVYHSGPAIYPLDNDHIILPASVDGRTNFDSVQNAAFLHHRYWDTPTNMLLNESEPDGPQNENGDYYQGISANWERIVRYARMGRDRDSEQDSTQIEKDLAAGVNGGTASTNSTEQVEILEAHMKWRRWVTEGSDGQGIQQGDGTVVDSGQQENASAGSAVAEPIAGSAIPSQASETGEGTEYLATGGEAADLADAGSTVGRSFDDGTFIDTDGRRKQMVESNLIVRFIRGLNLIVGVQDADEVYPDTPIKRPFFELALLNDGQYWSMGLIELAEQIEYEMTVLANQCIQASDMTIGPPVFYNPTVGEAAVTRKYEKFDLIPTTDPNAIKQLQINPNIEPMAQLWLMFQSLYEQLTGITNLTMGRGMDQPNAPRTLGGQRLVMGAGDVRLALDMRMLSEELKLPLDWIWDLWQMNGSEQEFYRVAEGDSQGLFKHGEINNGWATISAKEREAHYDFSLEFADDAQVKEGKKQEILALVAAVASFPYVQQNVLVQYRLLTDLFDRFGLDFTKYASEPPPPFLPILPAEAWTKLLEGEEVHVHPDDDDQAFIDDLEMRVMAMFNGPEEDRDMDAMLKARDLIAAHQQALVAKQQMAEVKQALGTMVAAAQLGGGQAKNGAPTDLMGMLAGLAGGGGQPPGAGMPQQGAMGQ